MGSLHWWAPRSTSVFDEMDEDLLGRVEPLPLLEDPQVVCAVGWLSISKRPESLGGRYLPLGVHVTKVRNCARVVTFYRVSHEKENPGVRHQAMDAGDAFLLEDRILVGDLASDTRVCLPRQGSVLPV